MGVNSANIYIDTIIGIAEFVLLLGFFIKTDKYLVFQFSYYYYLIVSPCLGLVELSKIILSPRLNIDKTQMDFISSDDSKLSANRRSQVLEIFQLLLLSLPSISPTLIELIFGIISVIIKYNLTKDISVNDIYLIHFTPTLLSVAPLCLKEIKSYFLGNVLLDNVYNPYIFFSITLSTLIAIGLNTLVLIGGGLIGLSICNSQH
jgi:hypothetical protein